MTIGPVPPRAAAALAEVRVGGAPDDWQALGFAVGDDVVRIGATPVRLVAGASGVLGWDLGAPPPGTSPAHPNGAERLDHVVVLVASIEAYAATLPVPLKRVCVGPAGTGRTLRQGFFRLGEVVLEAVEVPGAGPPRPWGLVVVVPDLDAVAAASGGRLGRVKDAVQPGRRIATVRPEAAGGLPLAFITP